MNETFSGIAIQFPYSSLIVSGAKTIETRIYPLPKKYVGKKLLIIETPGTNRKIKTAIIGWIVFGEPYLYSTKAKFDSEFKFHKVETGSIFYWQKDRPKWAWPITAVGRFRSRTPPSKRIGIKFTTGLAIK